MSEILKKLVKLKKQEADLKIGIATAQKEAIEEAMEHGKTGTIASIKGAKIVLKLMPVKPKPTKEILELQSTVDYRINRLKNIHEAEINELEALQRHITNRVLELLSDKEIKNLEFEIAQKFSELQGEMQPQISVTLPK
jgi:hypothetical protein